ncbi:MAG: electron transfer flavoprotein subunit alpha/FixB family protein [Thermodesulfobacteriota bacterium]|nr:electron transfer flavoprotein subunit alpha/FixB family protein [Thermodesulfobacteriota bacterium]
MDSNKDIWVLGDYRNYFQNRVTLQILARAVDIASSTGGTVCAIVFGHNVDEYVKEYIAHGAQKVYLFDNPALQAYSLETYSWLLAWLANEYQPETLLVGATRFGQEMAPRVAKKLKTGLTADCIDLELDEKGLLVQVAPSFGGNLIAKIITPVQRPQMATIRPGTFQELAHDYEAKGEVVSLPLPKNLPKDKIRLVSSEHRPPKKQKIENADIVICGGRGMGSKGKFKKLFDLAKHMNAEVGATRPVVYSEWVSHDALVGQAGKNIKPRILFSFGISGAIQHTAAITESSFIVSVNKNPNATMMKMADVAIVADANQVCLGIIKALKEKLRA